MHNSKNPYQGDAKKVLCVCSAGLLRSPTAAIVLNKAFGFNTRSCGYDVDHALIPFDAVLVYWADEIVVMENKMAIAIKDKYPDKKVICLNIRDDFSYMDKSLQKQIKENYKKESLLE